MVGRGFFWAMLGLALVSAGNRSLAQCVNNWLPGLGIPGISFGNVNALTSYDPDGPGPQSPVLIVGGGFSRAGDINSAYIAQWNGSSWQAVGTWIGQDVFAVAVYNGELIAGGYDGLARWDGMAWQQFDGIS